ncbi:MAG: ABC transporter substrate-binding protein [bacterium]|nr:MAG: ABC transporter substrate-binding protein [bacterium]
MATLSACAVTPPREVPPRPAPPPVARPAPEKKPAPPARVPSPAEAVRDREELLKYQEAVRVFREEGRPQEAHELLESFLRMHPESSYADDATLEQSRIQGYLGDWKKATTLLERLLTKYPTSPLRKRAFLEMMRIQRDRERWKDCIEASQSALSLDPLPDEKAELLTVGAVCRARRKEYVPAVTDIIEGYRSAMTDPLRASALDALEQVTADMKQGGLEDVLSGSDGMEPYGVLAMILLEKQMEKGLYKEAMAELMDILVHYPGQVPDKRIENAYVLLSDRLLVRTNVIGAVLPLSGRYAVFGEKALQGIQTALGFRTPTAGTGPESRFTLMVKDSGADPVQAAQAVRDLATSGQVIAIIGPIFSRTTRAASRAAEETGIPLISLSPDPEIPALGRNIFRRSLVDRQQVTALVRLVHDRLMMTRFAFLYPDNSYGKEMMNLFWDEVDLRGGEVVAAESFPPGQTDFGPQIRAMVGLNRKLTPEEQSMKEAGQEVELAPIIDFDALFIPADFQTVGLLAPQLAFYEVNEVLLVGTDGWNSPWLVELGEHYVEGALFTGGYLLDSAQDPVREMVESYWLTFGEDPMTTAIQAYDAALLIRTGVESGLVQDRSSLREYLMGLNQFPSAEGPLSTDSEGDILQTPFLLTVTDGRIVPFEMEID